MDASLNIVELIENNPITKLSSSYNGKLLTKIQEGFTDFEQQLFVSSFYCYLNCDPKNDFVIDLDDVWKWLGFNQKVNAKRVLEKNFIVDTDYKILLCQLAKQHENEKKHGGYNKEIIMLSIKTFKLFCIKTNTKKADEIHDYYLKMEEIIHQVVQEESDELKLQLEKKDKQLEQKDKQLEQKDKQMETAEQKAKRAVEQAIINQFPLNTECVYFGTIDNRHGEEKLIKFGQTNDLQARIYCHRSKFDNFVLINAFKVQNKVEIENLVKSHTKIKKQIRQICVADKSYKEIIAYDDTKFTIEKLSLYIKEIIASKQYSIDNFNLLTKQNDELGEALKIERDKNDAHVALSKSQELLIDELKKTVEQQKIRIDFLELENQNENKPLEKEEDKRFNQFVDECCFVNKEVEESSANLEGQFRIWNQMKPTKEVFHLLKEYMGTRFLAKRLQKQDKNQIVHGFAGIKLKTIDYKPLLEESAVQTFLFQVCRFSPCGRILNSKLLAEYQRWKKKLDLEVGQNDINELKEYLNASAYAQKSTIWDGTTSNEGYYGLSLRQDDEYQHKTTSSTGKKIQKVCVKTNQVLNTWDTILKAAIDENMSPATMSRNVKNKKMFGEFYYSTLS